MLQYVATIPAHARLYMVPLPPTTCAAALRGCLLPLPLPLALLPPAFCFFLLPCCEWVALRFCSADALVALLPTRVGRSLRAGRQQQSIAGLLVARELMPHVGQQRNNHLPVAHRPTEADHPIQCSLEGKGVRHVAQVQAPHVEDVLNGRRVSGIGAHPRPEKGKERK